MQLTEHFSLAEMTRSATAVRKGIRNNPGPYEIEALRLLCAHVLEPVRAQFGKPVAVTSGYRSPRLNKAIGGSATSDHCYGCAADFTVPGISNLEVCLWVHANLNYKQLIYEFGEDGWVHCAYAGPPFKNEELTATRKGGRTVYLPGIVA